MFLVVGAQRSGTTYLYTILDEHPEIYMAKPIRPEPKFFCVDENFKRGKDYYINKYFNIDIEKFKVIGEKSTSYLTDNKTPERIYSLFPSMKLIFVLRNPIERAISNYWFSVKNNIENESFEYAIKNEERRISNIHMKDFSDHPFAYLKRGKYISFIEQFLEYFPLEQMFFMKNEDLLSEEHAVISNLYNFLGVNMEFKPNKIGNKINYAERQLDVLTVEIRNYLLQYYFEYNKRLQELTKLDLSDWNN